MSEHKEEAGLSKIKEDLFSLLMQVHDTLKERVGFDVKPYKKYIENEILVTLAQMDKPSKIFDNLYLVSECSAFEKLLTVAVRSFCHSVDRCVLSPPCCHVTSVSSFYKICANTDREDDCQAFPFCRPWT